MIITDIKNNYRSEIDGIRTLAVLFVFFFHFNEIVFPNGFLGVDIFFVISGYVISQSIVKTSSSNIRIIDFFLRRVKRIYPALILMLGTSLLIISILLPINDLKLYFFSNIFSLIGFSNFYFFLTKQDYFVSEISNPYLHTWSLGVEEQFYLIYPFLLFVLFKILNSNKNFKWVVGCYLFLISTLIFILVYYLKDTIYGNFFFPLTSFWEILFGCSCFFLSSKKLKFFNFKYLGDFLFLIIFLITFSDILENEILIEKLIVVFLTGLILLNNSNYLFLKFLKNKFTVYFGKVSYGFYLWHLPILFILNYFIKYQFIIFILSLLLTFIISHLSYKYFEMPVRQNHSFDKLIINIIKFVPVTGFMLILFIFYNFNDSRNVARKIFEKYEIFASAININPNKKFYLNNTSYKKYKLDSIFVTDCRDDDIIDNKVIFFLSSCYKKNNSKVLILVTGDSTANAFIPVIDNSSLNLDFITIAKPGTLFSKGLYFIKNNDTSYVIDKKINKNKNFLNKVHSIYLEKKNSYNKTIIILNNIFENYLYNDDGYLINDKKILIEKDDLNNVFTNQLKALIQMFDTDTEVILIKELFKPELSLDDCLKFVENKSNCKNNIRFVSNEYEKNILKLENELNNFTYVDLNKIFCDENKNCKFFWKDYSAVFDDKVHFTIETAEYLSKFFDEILKKKIYK